MNYAVKDLPKSLKEVKITVAANELKPHLERAAAELSQRVKIEGFRPGKASYDVVRSRFGEMAILEEALPSIVQKHFVEVVKKENLETVGEPTVNVEKAAPGNDVVFSVKVALMPRVLKMQELSKLKIAAKDAKIEESEVERVVSELRKMQSSEHGVDRAATKGDKVTVDMNMSKSGIPVTGGEARNHSLYTDEAYYVPGLNEQLFGLKKGDRKTFKLPFPKEHFQKELAGHDVEFAVEVKNIHEIRHPEATDDFAKSLGQESLEKLRALLRRNLEDEAANKEKQRQEAAVLEALVKESKFDEIPELLVNAETHKMLHELEHSIERQNLPFEDYLKQTKKTRDQLLLDFAPEALKRVKSTLIVRKVAALENLEADDKEVVDEQARMLNMYSNDPKTQEQIRSEDGEAYIRTMLRNRKVMEFMRKSAVK